MLNLLFKLEFSKKKKLVNYLKNIGIFTVFTLLIYLALSNLNVIVNSNISLQIYIVLNIMVISITHYLIQKLFFPKLEEDVVLIFLPEKAYEYIEVRLLLILLKWNMPFIIPTILNLKKSFLGSNFIYGICAILFSISWLIINYLIVIYVRYMMNNFKGIEKCIFNIVVFFTYVAIIVLPNFYMYNFLEKDEFEFISINNPIKIHTYFIMILAFILLILLLTLKSTEKYFRKNIRLIIENKSCNKIEKHNNRVGNRVVKVFLNICFLGLSNLEKKLFIKDVKSFYRESRKTFTFLIYWQLFSMSFLLYIYYNSVPKSMADIFNLIIMLQIVMIPVALMPNFLFSNFTLRNYLKIDEDINLLKAYNIKINKDALLKSKKRLAITILYSHIFIFYFIAFVTVMNIFACIGVLLSCISILLIVSLINLNLVKYINKKNSRNIAVRTINTLTVIGCVIIFKRLFTSGDFKNRIIFYLVFNAMLIVSYWSNYKINITKEKKEGTLLCCK